MHLIKYSSPKLDPLLGFPKDILLPQQGSGATNEARTQIYKCVEERISHGSRYSRGQKAGGPWVFASGLQGGKKNDSTRAHIVRAGNRWLRLGDLAGHDVILGRQLALLLTLIIKFSRRKLWQQNHNNEWRKPMDPVAIIIMLAIGAVAGWLAGLIYSGSGFGLIGNIIVGILGAIVAGFLLPGLFSFDTTVGQIISATIGAIILLFIVGLVRTRFAWSFGMMSVAAATIGSRGSSDHCGGGVNFPAWFRRAWESDHLW
jgi:uncharacterized membrane protein YeaQ/YmgE (transglycosylase-associated protein family)